MPHRGQLLAAAALVSILQRITTNTKLTLIVFSVFLPLLKRFTSHHLASLECNLRPHIMGQKRNTLGPITFSHSSLCLSPSFLSWRLSNGWQGRLSLTGRWWSKLHWQRRYIWAASAATPARPELLWESRRPSQCRLSYFSPDQRRHDTFGTDFVSYFSQTRLQPSQLGCREFFLREFFFSSRSLQTSHQCLLEADGSQIFRILSSRCSVWNFIR